MGDRNRLVYLAGPIAGDPFGCVRTACAAFTELRALGLVPFLPQLSVLAEMVEHRDYEDWLAYDFDVICHCAALVRLPGESPGADREIELAISLGIPVFALPDGWAALRDWVAAGPQTTPQVLWEGDLGELMHAVNGTPIMSALLDAFPADEPGQWQVRIQRVVAQAGEDEAATNRVMALLAGEGTTQPDPGEHDEQTMAAALAPFGWTCGPDFWQRYHSDPWVFNLANAVERLSRRASGEGTAPQVPAEVLWEGETVAIPHGSVKVSAIPGPFSLPAGTRVRVVAAPTSQQDPTDRG